MRVSTQTGCALCLNAPFGAWCFLTVTSMVTNGRIATGLNAPYGVRCFLANEFDIDFNQQKYLS